MQAGWIELRCAHADDESWDTLAARIGAAQASEQAPNGAITRLLWIEDTPGALEGALALAAALGLSPHAIEVRRLQTQDWARSWQAHWRGTPIGRRLWVRPGFRDPAPAGRIEIVLDPGMAFGTGRHPTTRLCLEAIEDALARRPACSLLDFGAGSGILAIAAAKLGARPAVAVDCDPEAVRTIRANAARNAVAIHAARGSTPPGRRFDLVVANILAEPLIELAPRLAATAERRLILSGLLVEQIEPVQTAYAAHGLVCIGQRIADGWAALELAPARAVS